MSLFLVVRDEAARLPSARLAEDVRTLLDRLVR